MSIRLSLTSPKEAPSPNSGEQEKKLKWPFLSGSPELGRGGFRLCLLPLLLLLPAGCAKSPSGGNSSPASGTQVFVSMTVAGTVNPSNYYYVVFNVNSALTPGQTQTGPIPVVTVLDTGGNGFAAGSFSHYVEFNQTVPGGTNIGFYGISSDLLTPTFIGQPGSSSLVQAQVLGNTLTLQIPLAALATPSVPAGSITSIQVNFITTNLVTSNPSAPEPKLLDALGQTNQPGGLNNPVTIPTTQSGIYNNATTRDEAAGDVTEYVNGQPVTATDQSGPPPVTVADLDITDWSVQIR